MTMSKHSKGMKQMLLLVDFLANPLVWLESKKQPKTTDIFGPICLELLKKQNLLGSLGRMSEILLASQTAWYSNKCTLTWKVKVTKSNRLLYQLQQSTLPTNDTEHGLWRTPTAEGDGGKRGLGKMTCKEAKEKNRQITLSRQVRENPMMWPTPTTKGYGHASMGQTMIMRKKVEAKEITEKEAQAMMNGVTLRPPRMKQWMWPTPNSSPNTISQTVEATLKLRQRDRKQGQLMEAVVDKMWPTPTAGRADQGMSPSQEKRNSLNLAQTVQVREGFWPTPTVNDSKNNAGPSQLRRTGTNLNVADYKQEGIGTLNPMWVEWLMGYPIGWTDLED